MTANVKRALRRRALFRISVNKTVNMSADMFIYF